MCTSVDIIINPLLTFINELAKYLADHVQNEVSLMLPVKGCIWGAVGGATSSSPDSIWSSTKQQLRVYFLKIKFSIKYTM